MRCFSPLSMVVQSAAPTMRGRMSNGKMRSVPASSPYTVNVMPRFSRSSSAAFWRRANSPSGSEVTRSSSGAAPGRASPPGSIISS